MTAHEPTDDPMISYGRRLSQLAERHPEKVAIVQAAVDGSERTVTWGELERRANQVARLLAEHGVDEESLVAVALPNSPEHFFCCYGAWKLGRRPCCRCDGTSPRGTPTASWAWPRPRRCSPTGPTPRRPRSPPRRSTRRAALDDGPLPDTVPRHARAIATSGSTGSPKLIVTPTPGVMAGDFMSTASAFTGVRDQAVQLVISPLYHTNGFACHIGLLADQTLVVMERFDPSAPSS